MKKKSGYSLIGLLLAAALTTAACNSSTANTDSSGAAQPTDGAAVTQTQGEQRTIGTVLISGTNPHCQIFEAGFRGVVEGRGDKAVVLDADYDPTKLVNCIADLVAQGVDGIVVEACDNQAPIQGIKEATAKGIVVAGSDMLIDVTEEDGALISQTVTDNYSAGLQCGQDFVKRANGAEMNFCIMEFKTNTSAVERINGFMDAVEGHDNLHLLEINQPNPETLEAKLAVMDTWLQKYDKIDCVFAYHDPAAMACIQSLEAAGRLEGTLIYSVDGNEDALQAIVDGKMTGTAKQQPEKLAALAAEDIYKVLDGEELGHDWVVYVPVQYIDSTNAAEFLNK